MFSLSLEDFKFESYKRANKIGHTLRVGGKALLASLSIRVTINSQGHLEVCILKGQHFL